LAIPDFQTLMRPLLELAADGKEHTLAEAREKLAEIFKLTEEEKIDLLPSGRTPRFTNRVAWAKVYLGHANALDSPRRGVFRITDRGLDLLKTSSGRVAI
jgi:restriction system protein